MNVRGDYDPYRTPPLWIEPKEPLDYVHDEQHDGDDRQDHEDIGDGLDRRPERPVGEFAKPCPNSTQRRSSMWLRDFLLPRVNATPEEERRHRLYLSITVCALTALVPLQYGIVPGVSFLGFAYASNVNKIEIRLIKKDLFDTIKSHCVAPTADSKEFYAKQKGELLQSYEKTVGQPYREVPTCKDLGVRWVEVSPPSGSAQHP